MLRAVPPHTRESSWRSAELKVHLYFYLYDITRMTDFFLSAGTRLSEERNWSYNFLLIFQFAIHSWAIIVPSLEVVVSKLSHLQLKHKQQCKFSVKVEPL